MNDYIELKYENDKSYFISRDDFHEFCDYFKIEIFDLFKDDIQEMFKQELNAYFEEEME